MRSHKIFWDLSRSFLRSHKIYYFDIYIGIWHLSYDCSLLSFILCHLSFVNGYLTFDTWHLIPDTWHRTFHIFYSTFDTLSFGPDHWMNWQHWYFWWTLFLSVLGHEIVLNLLPLFLVVLAALTLKLMILACLLGFFL